MNNNYSIPQELKKIYRDEGLDLNRLYDDGFDNDPYLPRHDNCYYLLVNKFDDVLIAHGFIRPRPYN